MRWGLGHGMLGSGCGMRVLCCGVEVLCYRAGVLCCGGWDWRELDWRGVDDERGGR